MQYRGLLQVRGLLVEMIVGGVSLEVVDELRSAASNITDCSLHDLLTDAVTSVVTTLRLVCCHGRHCHYCHISVAIVRCHHCHYCHISVTNVKCRHGHYCPLNSF